jgi:hypothetical protein
MNGPVPTVSLVVYAKDREGLARFYAALLGLQEVESGPGFTLLAARGVELAVVGIRSDIAARIELSSPPVVREDRRTRRGRGAACATWTATTLKATSSSCGSLPAAHSPRFASLRATGTPRRCTVPPLCGVRACPDRMQLGARRGRLPPCRSTSGTRAWPTPL